MRTIKSERLKKLEAELLDLSQWLKLGLVPKKDIEKHKEEILSIEEKIEEEKQRLLLLKESGEAEENPVPKRAPGRGGYSEMPTIPDIDMAETAGGFDEETEDRDTGTEDKSTHDEDDEEERSEEGTEETFEEESYFSDKNRWRRGGIVDPDADEW